MGNILQIDRPPETPLCKKQKLDYYHLCTFRIKVMPFEKMTALKPRMKIKVKELNGGQLKIQKQIFRHKSSLQISKNGRATAFSLKVFPMYVLLQQRKS